MEACSIGLHNLVKKTLDNKPYFSYKENGNFGTITILDSFTKKINIKNSIGVASTVATSINTAINNGYKNIGNVAFVGFDDYNRGIVNIKATNNQLNLINAIDNSKEAEELQKEVDKEREIEEERALRESKKEEWEENREYFENDEPFTRVSVNKKPIQDTGIQGTLFQEPGRSLQELDNLPEKEIENLQSTVEYQILKEQEDEDLTIKGGQSYVFLNKKDAERFSFLLNKEGEFPKEFRVEKKITRYKKDSEVKGKFNAFNEYEDYIYVKVNNNKKSNIYHIINEKTQEVIAENVRVLHVSKDVKKGISEKYGLEFTPTKVFSANRSIGFTLYRLKPSKNKYVAQAKKYLYDALKFLNPEETNLKINLDKIEKFLESFPKDMWDYINTTYSPEDSTNINASISLQNEIKFKLPKLGFLQEIEKISGIKLQGVSFKNYDRTGALSKVFKYSKLDGNWGDTITISSSDMTTKELKASISYYLKTKNIFKTTSEEENVKKYAEHRGIDYNKLRELVFGDLNKALDNISYNTTGNSDTIELSKWRESIRNYNWQSAELFEKPYESFQNKVKERITKKFKDKTLSNGISHLDYFFSGNFNWLNINFNNISGQYFMSDMETEADTGFDVKMVGFANPFELKTYKKPKSGKNFLEEKEVFNRLAAILHEPFHALHALSYGTEEELQLRKAFDNLYNTDFGKEMMNQVFGSGYNQGQQISYDTLYKEFTAFATQLMLYPKEWITKTDLRSNDIYDFIQKIQTLQDKTYEEIIRTQKKIGTTEKTITEEEQIKLTFLEKLYNYLVSALNKIIPLSKKFFDVIADSKLVEKTVIEDVFGETEETVTKTLKLPENIKKAKEEFLSSMEDLKSAINTLMQIDSKLFSPDNINKFFNKDQFNQEPGKAEEPNIKPGVEELFESNQNLANAVYEAMGFTGKLKVSLGKELEYKDPYAKNRIKDFKKYEVLDNSGKNIGTVVIEDRGNKTVILHPELSVIGKGYGKDLYKTISSKLGVTIQEWTEGAISKSDSAKAMWDSLKKEGSAIRIVNEEDGDNFRQLTYSREITPQQKQKALQLYSQYLEQNPNGSVEQFKSWVEEFNRNKNNLEQQSENKTIDEIYKEKPYLKEFIDSVTDESSNISIYKVKNTLDKHGEGRIVKLNKILYNAINRLWDNNVFAQNNIKIKFVDFLPENAVGNFNRDDNEITIDKRKFLNNVIDDDRNYPIFYLGYILNHEIIHYLTPKDLSLKIEYVDRALNGRFGDTFRLESEKEFGKNIKELYDVAIEKLDNVEDYGFLNLAEFVAEAMSNPSFQEKLASIPFKTSKQSLWKRFIKILSDYLSLDTKKPITDTLLEAVIAETTNYITENSNIQRTYKRRKSGKTENIDIRYDFVYTTQKNINTLSDFISQKSQERLKTIQEVFNSNPELSKIGDVFSYAIYLDTIFPDSKVKDIVYHGSDSKKEKFSSIGAGTHFGTLKAAKERRNKAIIPVILNINNPVLFKDILADDVLKAADEFLKENGEYLEYGYRNEESGLLVYLHKQGKIDSDTLWDALYSNRNTMMQILQNALGSNGYRYINEVEDKGSTSYVVFEPEQIHILGNKQDIEGFKEFVGKSTQTVESYRAQEQAELSQRIPNIENYKVDGKVVKSLITDENDLKIYNEIYNKYDALITPLLEALEETKEQPEDILKTYEEDLEQDIEDLEDTEDTSNINEDDDFLEQDFPVEEKENKPDVKYTFNEEFELLNRKLISLGLNTLSLEDYDNFTNIQKEIIKSCYGI